MTPFDRAMVFVLRWEGGATITEDPADPGGLTKYGISQKAHPTINIRGLTEGAAKAIYRMDYWTPSGCEDMPWPLCLAVMDFAVNSGVLEADKAVAMLSGDPASEPLLAAYEVNSARMGFLLRLAERRPKLRRFLRGWMNRVSAVFEEIQAAQKERT